MSNFCYDLVNGNCLFDLKNISNDSFLFWTFDIMNCFKQILRVSQGQTRNVSSFNSIHLFKYFLDEIKSPNKFGCCNSFSSERTVHNSFYLLTAPGQWRCKIVKLGSMVSHTKWSNISERKSNLIENLKKGPELTL